MVATFSKIVPHKGRDHPSLDSGHAQSSSGLSGDSGSIFAKSIPTLSLASIVKDISDPEPSSLALPSWPTSSTSSTVSSASSSSSNIFDEKCVHDLLVKTRSNTRRKPIGDRYLHKLQSFYRSRTPKGRHTKRNSFLNPRSSITSAICKIDNCIERISKAKATVKPDDANELSIFDRACHNCRHEYIIIRTLNNLLADLIKQKVASGCDMKVTEKDVTNGAYAIERILELNTRGKYVDDSPQGLYQMTRICEWKCAGIEDDLRGMQLIMSDGGPLFEEIRRAFIEKWGSEPHLLHGGIHIDCKYTTLRWNSNIQEFLQGDIVSHPIGSVLPFWPTIQKEIRSKEFCFISGRESSCNLHATLLEKIAKLPSRHLQQQLLIERCLYNIEVIQSSIDILFDEIDLEKKRRRACRHSPTCKHQSDTLLNLGKTLVLLNDMTSALNAVTRHVHSGLQRGLQEIDLTIVADWQSLDGNPYGNLMFLTSDKIVERLVKTPLWEEEVTEVDETLRKIRRTSCQTRQSESRPIYP